MYKGVIFDLDGTLINSIGDLAAACNYGLEKCGFPVHEVEQYKTFVGDGRYKLIERMISSELRTEENINRLLELFDEYYGAHMFDNTKPYEGAIELIDEIRTRGIKTAVVSNKPHEFTTKIVKDFLGDRFEVVFGHRPGCPTKPDAYSVNEVIKMLGLKKSECLYVGDSNVDIITARNSEVKSVGVLWGFRSKEELVKEGADYIAEDMAQLKKYILE
ncbi:HAD family hydrolase [Inconstantimicrobium porci]|uniref:HAD family hydrolase n=1 Tax=Inconstantimicrobium porci TaxID=2652291 RepID=A0A7X2T0I4_9CLOT|nr:HAD family hydrolase [Inconstantimicrobium porci]MDD6770845.1 HAD family hydrolase [Inconstantimicrobium porci]MSR90554.1 HAD family hydrolase [Inconstantimicrobium porci]